jgi:hypothetical protein
MRKTPVVMGLVAMVFGGVQISMTAVGPIARASAKNDLLPAA